MTAYNAASGERFNGQYTGRYTGGSNSLATLSGPGGNIIYFSVLYATIGSKCSRYFKR